MSAFDNWFTLQYGKRQRSDETDAALMDVVVGGQHAQAELSRRHAWDAARTVAMYAWQVSDAARKLWKARSQ